MKVKLSISTCPNDTFMFDALINKKIDCKGYDFEVCMEDIEQLNRHIQESEDIGISKISYAVYPKIASRYILSRSGSALGRGNGPLLVSRYKIYPDEIQDVTIGIPGANTTANALLDFAFKNIKNKKEYLFSDIADAIMCGEIEAGVLIHEQRFVFEKIGLKLICDLGDRWEKETSMAIPLGAIAVNRSFEDKVQEELSHIIKQSVLYAINNPKESWGFVKQYAKETDDRVIENHIEMFVNDYSIDISKQGEEAVSLLFNNKFNINTIFI